MCQVLQKVLEKTDRHIPCIWKYLAIKLILSQAAFLAPVCEFLFLSCQPLSLSHTPPLSLLTTLDCVWSNSNLMNLLIFLAWHADTSQISTSEVAQFILILKILLLLKQLIPTVVQMLMFNELCGSFANLGSLNQKLPHQKSRSIPYILVQIWLIVDCEWSGGAEEQQPKVRNEVRKQQRQTSAVNATLRCWQEGGVH